MFREEIEKKQAQRLAVVEKLAAAGVQFIDEMTAYIDDTVTVGAGTVIGPCVTLKGSTAIGCGCFIGQNSVITDSKIADNVNIMSSVITESAVGSGTAVGPFAYMRPGSRVGADCKVGDFVELKNATLGDGTKASHLTYIGDADVGAGVNLGCGVVFVNYDGTHKYRSTVEDGAFIGCNCNLVSPVRIGEGAYIAAGSTVTEDVQGDALYIARSRGREIPGWVSARGIWKKKDKKQRDNSKK